MKNKILQGDALKKLKELPDKSINMLMTSPPYWALRDYGTDVETIWDERYDKGIKGCWNGGEHDFELKDVQAGTQHWNQGGKVIPYKERKIHYEKLMQVGFCNKCGAWKGQLGLEPTFDLYIKHLCDIFDEVKRVLRDDGTCWVNIGDTYSGGGGWTGIPEDWESISTKSKQKRFDNPSKKTSLPSKTLTMIPFRFAIEMVNRGWILRNTIIWHKRNCMPSSAKDRFTVDFEYLFFFSKKKKYYFETQYEPHKWADKDRRSKFPRAPKTGKILTGQYAIDSVKYGKEGRNKRTVWTINPKPFKEAHFAVYPEELCETPIKAGCPEGGIVLDPFFGSGTTGLVALKQNKKFIGIELNPEYIKIAKKRLKPFLEQTKL